MQTTRPTVLATAGHPVDLRSMLEGSFDLTKFTDGLLHHPFTVTSKDVLPLTLVGQSIRDRTDDGRNKEVEWTAFFCSLHQALLSAGLERAAGIVVDSIKAFQGVPIPDEACVGRRDYRQELVDSGLKKLGELAEVRRVGDVLAKVLDDWAKAVKAFGLEPEAAQMVTFLGRELAAEGFVKHHLLNMLIVHGIGLNYALGFDVPWKF